MTRTTIRRRRLSMVIEGELPPTLFELIAMDNRVSEFSLIDITNGDEPSRPRFMDVGSARSQIAQKEILDVMGTGGHHYSDFNPIAAKHGFQSTHGLLCKLKERGLVTTLQRGVWAKV